MGCFHSKAAQPAQPDAKDLPRLLDSLAEKHGASKGGNTVQDAAASSAWRPATSQEVESRPEPRSSQSATWTQEQRQPTVEVEDTGVTSSSWFCCMAQRAWESELLQVASDLKCKLSDPHFVAMRCDLDSSGDSDAHELKQAARVFGMRPSEEELQDLMAGHQRITKEHFAKIILDFQQRPESAHSQRVVPHSLRGMALGQLQHLEEVFVKSGWLAMKCDSFNEEHAEAILAKKKFRQAPNLYALDSFVVTPMSEPGWCATCKQDSKQTIPWANLKSSFSELLNPHGLLVHVFVSHFWGHLYSSTVMALNLWALKHFSNYARHPSFGFVSRGAG
ncbi:Ank3 [Symbiodinium pilosum]|uniref:Ank3 protein n=1 Tax=Symbiodinium pilosum TaxID=2952 RepID=A0A812NE45_SYMPI|nr:Ank3 [Symbiodinium pilosum]